MKRGTRRTGRGTRRAGSEARDVKRAGREAKEAKRTKGEFVQGGRCLLSEKSLGAITTATNPNINRVSRAITCTFTLSEDARRGVRAPSVNLRTFGRV